jgi:hypothetical protein
MGARGLGESQKIEGERVMRVCGTGAEFIYSLSHPHHNVDREKLFGEG